MYFRERGNLKQKAIRGVFYIKNLGNYFGKNSKYETIIIVYLHRNLTTMKIGNIWVT